MKAITLLCLNVGGKPFHVKREILSNSTYFNSLLGDAKEGTAFSESENEHIFIDRNGDIFRHVLQYLRTGRIFVNKDSTLNQLKEEAKYYGLNDLLKDIEDKEAGIGDEENEYMFLSPEAMLKLFMETLTKSTDTTDQEGKNYKACQVIASLETSGTRKVCFLDNNATCKKLAQDEGGHHNKKEIEMPMKKTLVRRYISHCAEFQ